MNSGSRSIDDGESMDGFVELTSPVEGVQVFMAPVGARELKDTPLADPAEVATFATDKRRDEHLTGRWLLGAVLQAQGETDLSSLEVIRSEHRAPSLARILGVWRRTPLPSISIAHSEGMAFVALADRAWSVGVDAEPLDRTLAPNAFDLMAKGAELQRLEQQPHTAMRLWTGKEAVQKSMGFGMHLNPREIEIPIEDGIHHFSIRNLKIQLVYWSENDYHLSLAVCPASADELTPEDRLLEQTRAAMKANPGWGVGCNTQRNNA
jgi:phosphopantetheinyl transferase